VSSEEEYENERIKELRVLLTETPYQRAVSLFTKLLLLRPSKQRTSNKDKAETKRLIQHRNCAHDMFTNVLASKKPISDFKERTLISYFMERYHVYAHDYLQALSLYGSIVIRTLAAFSVC
jgi:hypothetical protein